jgi:hypothetical protein
MSETIELHGWNFSQVPIEVIMDKTLTGNDVRIFSYLVWRAGLKDRAWPGIKRMAEDMGMSDPTIRRSLANLIVSNWIRRRRRYGSSSVTFLFDNKDACQVFDDQLTGELMISSPVSSRSAHRRAVNDSKSNESKEDDSNKKSDYVIAMEKLEEAFSVTRGVMLPDWDNEPQEAMKTWRKPLNDIFKRCNKDLTRAEWIVRESTLRMMRDGLTFHLPVQIRRTALSLIADGVGIPRKPGGNGSGMQYRGIQVTPSQARALLKKAGEVRRQLSDEEIKEILESAT